MKNIAIILLALLIYSCGNNNTEGSSNQNIITNNENINNNSEAFKLMEQKCMICHLEKPSFENKDNILAPPMMKIKEHYLPSYPKRDDFIKAVVDFSKNPTEEKIMMPGAARKFNIMPALGYSDKELKLIAGIIYDTDFGTIQKIKNMGNLELNSGKKWIVKPEAIEQIKEITKKLNNFQSDNITDYNQLGSDIFNKAKMMMLDKDYDDATLMQIKIFFHGIEDDMHELIGEQSVEKAKKELSKLEAKFKDFFKYFE